MSDSVSPKAYKAFVTYGHADIGVADAVQSGLHSFAKPWTSLRAVRVFRDKTNLTANPDLWSSIEQAIANSEYLLIMASPQAAHSQWVPREIEAFVQCNSTDKVILVLTDGELAWDNARQDFDWDTTTSFPKLERKVFQQLPLYLDLRWARKTEHLSLRNPDFKDAVANLSSTIRGIPLDVLIGRDVREHKKTMRLAWSAVAALLTLTLVLLGVSIAAVRARARAEQERDLAVSRQLAMESRVYLDEAPDLALLLASEAAHTADTVEARSALLESLQRSPQLVAVLRAHNAAVTSVAFSPDGRLASGGRDGDPTLRLWDAKTFQPLIDPIPTEKFRVEHVAFSSDGKTLASAGDAGVIRLFNGETGKSLEKVLTVTPPSVNSMAVSRDGKLASGGNIGGLSLWNLATGAAVVPPIQAHPEEWARAGVSGSNGINSLAFSADGKVLASGAEDATIAQWNANTLQRLRDPIKTKKDDGVESLAFSPDDQVLASANGGSIQLWDPATGRLLAANDQVRRRVTALAYAPNGALISAGDDSAIRIWDGKTLKPAGSIAAHQSHIWSLAFNKDGLLASAGGDGSIVIWNLYAISPVARALPPNSGRVEGLASCPGGVLASADGKHIRFTKLATGAAAAPNLDNGRELLSRIAVSRNGVLAGGGEDGSIRLWNLQTRGLIAEAPNVHKSITVDGQPMSDIVNGLAFSPDGAVLASAGFVDGTFLLWDGKTGAALTDKPIPAGIGEFDDLAFSPDGATLATSGESGMIRLWNVRTRQPMTPPVRAHGSGRPQIVFGDDTDPARVVIGEGAGSTFVAFSADGKLASGSFDRFIRLWNAQTLAPVGSPIAFPVPVRSVAFSPDGRLLACGGWGGVVRLYDAGTLQFIGSLLAGQSNVTRMSFSDDGAILAASFDDGSLIEWNVTLAAWDATATRIAHRSLSQAERDKFLK